MDLRRAETRAGLKGGPRDRRKTRPGRSLNSVVKSPCVEVCQINAERGFCIGCCRTLDEIARWREMSDAQREALLAALPARQAAMRLAPFPP